MMREIWVYIDRRDERLFHKSLRALMKGRGLARELGAKIRAVTMGGAGCLDAGPVAERCVAHGADYITVAELPGVAEVRADVYARALARLVRERDPALVLFAQSDLGRETAARTARLSGAGMIADAESFAVEDGKVYARCPAWAGEAEAEIYFADPARTGFITVGPHGGDEDKRPGSPGEVERIEVAVAAPARLQMVSSEAEPAERLKLEDAEVVVVGGAGVGSAEGFGRLRELAAALGGEVGATRPAVLSHWASEEHLIGQTGKTVRPGLLVTVGTSGAVQYTAGIMESRRVVAVNRDPEAPIFAVADVGVVEDAGRFMPLLIEKVKQAALRRLADALGDEGEKGGQRADFGTMVRGMRESRGWTTTDLADATGHDPDLIEQVEAGEITPSVSFLLRLAKALGVDPNAFLTPEEKTVIQDQRAKAFVTRTQNYSYETLTPGADNQHLRAFMITIEARQAHKPVAYKHEGEEFVFVIAGELELTVGNQEFLLKPGESRHFNSEAPHKLRSLSDHDTQCLVMLYTP